MSLIEMITLLAEGNPGAVTAMVEMIKVAEKVDPDSALGAFGPILSLDSDEIYGSAIWVLYSELCGRDVVKTLGLLRAIQLGLCEAGDIRGHSTMGSSREESNSYVGRMVEAVRERLPRFGMAT